MKERKYSVYKHTTPSNGIYIGITRMKPEKRWDNGNGYKTQIFWRAIEKYGWNNIQHEVLATNLTKEEAEQMEIKLIAKYRSNGITLYNIANGGNSIGKHSEETKKKMSKAHKGNTYGKGHIVSQEHREKLRKSHIGKTHSQEIKEKISKSKIGKNMGKDNYSSKKVVCLTTKEIFDCINEAERVYNTENISRSCINKGRISGKTKDGKPLLWMYYEEYIKIPKDKIDFVINKMLEYYKTPSNAKAVICNNEFFKTTKECAEFYGENPANMRRWLDGTRKMKQDFKDMDLHYATKDEIDDYFFKY